MILFFLKFFRKIFNTFFTYQNINTIEDINLVSELIYNIIQSKEPKMISRFGAFELEIIANSINFMNKNKDYIKFIKSEIGCWEWEEALIKNFSLRAGFFPYNDKILINEYTQVMLHSITQVDLLGSWLKKELIFEKELKNATKVNLETLNPFFAIKPWSYALKNKKILVIHPYKDTIEFQYQKRNLLFANNLLPDFELFVIRAPNNRGSLDNNTNFTNWFSALDSIKNQIDKHNFDVCLIGCGAYGFILADYVKKKGRISIHLGGSLQLLFGIIGNRWLNKNYNKLYNYSNLINEHWTRPFDSDITFSHKNMINDYYF